MADQSRGMPDGPVLIVEDEALVAMFLVDIVEDLGGTVMGPAADRDAALNAASENPPAVAIIDINLGSAGSGIDVARQLQAAHGTAIIFLSGYADMAADKAIQAIDPVAVLQKPCPPQELAAALRAAGG